MALMDNLRRLFRGGGGRPARTVEPTRDTIAYTSLQQVGQNIISSRAAAKATPRNMRRFSQTPYARRAINAIKNPIASLEWEIKPIKGAQDSPELQRQIELATYCFQHPNVDDSFRSLIEAVIEDIMLGAGAIEKKVTGDALRPLWMWPVDGLTIKIYPDWKPESGRPRYQQDIGPANSIGTTWSQHIELTNDELIYIRPNPTSGSPFGLGPLEVAFMSVSRILGVGEFAGNVAQNARPSIGIDLGGGATDEAISKFKAFWRTEVEGQGNIPVFGIKADGEKVNGPQVLRFYPEGDAALYLEYQSFLKTEIALAFDLSPMNLGVERDVNRSTAEVAEDRDWDNAIKPHARLVASHLTREALHAGLGFSQLEFTFVGLDREDEESTAKIYETYYQSNAITPNEQREKMGMPRLETEFADLTNADVQIAMQAARGVGQIEDKDLGQLNHQRAAQKEATARNPVSRKNQPPKP